jgi:hypothetical protein
MRKSILMALVGCICLLSQSALASECVPENEALKAWSEAVARVNRPKLGYEFVYAVCNPCSCPVNGQAACYEYLADKERNEEKRRKEELDLLDRAINKGICR